ncbi:peptidoglycan editing factor PgeF [Massilia sp. TS11]|uniref:peptidoglycan editing factor PgeF n=1 Tax=Massilia sp. TS11 TaxID=2908003 RepID=UPI001EDB2C1A|nr:peptidoglycan editing factor PgeF [Massilia sp. TS11]MCG2584568.1 peptidoglycan editing factor PgeF [Massilia sp. TS11]
MKTTDVHPLLLLPDWPDLPARARACSTTRIGGVSSGAFDDGQGGGGLNLGRHVGDDDANVLENRRRLQAALGVRPAFVSQVHGVAVADAAAVLAPDAPVHTADALIATTTGQACTIMTADCLPVLFAALDGSCVGAAHAGWRGLADGVLASTVAAMRAAGAGELTCWLGPAIGPAQFEVGAEVLDTFVQRLGEGARAAFAAYPGRAGKYRADIYALARLALGQAGVHRIHGGGRCTVSERALFYSYRRERATGRQASLIWLAAD